MDVYSAVGSGELVARRGGILPFISPSPRPLSPGGGSIERGRGRGGVGCTLEATAAILCARHSSHRVLASSKQVDQEESAGTGDVVGDCA